MKKMIDKILSAALALSLSLTAIALPSTAAEADFEDAYEAVENITVGWNLGNTLDPTGDWIDDSNGTAPYETAWGNPVTTKEMLTVVKDAGFNAVRVPVSWAQHIDDEGNIDKEWLDRVNEVVDYVISQDMYCILNTHHEREYWFKASSSSYNTYEKSFAALWEQIARRFRNYGEKLIFEAYNEIRDEAGNWTETNDADAYDAANKFNQLFVDTVRLTGGSNGVRNLMVQTYSAGCSGTTFNRFVLPSDTARNHIIIQVHNYDPQTFTDKTITWATPTKEWGSDADKMQFDELMESLKTFSREMKAPIVIGEFGSMDQNNTAARARHAGYFVKSAYERGIKCFFWDDGGNYILLDRKALKWKFPAIVEEMIKAVPAPTPSEPPLPEKPAVTVPEEIIKAFGGKALEVVELSDIKEIEFNLESGDVNKFASLMKYDSAAKKAECVAVRKIEGTAFKITPETAGSYFLIVDSETKLAGDLTNDGVINALDASVLLKNISAQKDSGFKGDFNGDGNVNAIDVSAILKYSAA